MKKRLTISIFFFSLFIRAQETLELFSVAGRYGIPQSYDSIYKSKAKERGMQINLVAPIKINEKSIWYNSINYFGSYVSNDEQLTPDIANPINIHGIIIRTGLYHKFSKGRSIQVFFAPRLMSDFNSIDKNHFQFGGMVLYNKKYSETLTMGFGLNYNQELFGPYLVPLVNLDWKLNTRWSIKGVLPIYAKIKYEINDRFNIGYHHFGLLTTYSLGAPEYKGDYMERNSIDETIFARYHITKNIHVEGRFGYAFGRSYTQYESDQKVKFSIPLVGFGDDRVQKNISFEDGLITSFRFVYNIPIPDSK